MNNPDDEENEWLSKTDEFFIEDFKKEFSSPVQFKKCTCKMEDFIPPKKWSDKHICGRCGGEL